MIPAAYRYTCFDHLLDRWLEFYKEGGYSRTLLSSRLKWLKSYYEDVPSSVPSNCMRVALRDVKARIRALEILLCKTPCKL